MTSGLGASSPSVVGVVDVVAEVVLAEARIVLGEQDEGAPHPVDLFDLGEDCADDVSPPIRLHPKAQVQPFQRLAEDLVGFRPRSAVVQAVARDDAFVSIGQDLAKR